MSVRNAPSPHLSFISLFFWLAVTLLRKVRRSAGRRAWKDSPPSGRPKRLALVFKREPTQRPHFPAKFKPEATFTGDVIDPFPKPHPRRGKSGPGLSGHADMPVDGRRFITASPASTSRFLRCFLFALDRQKTPALSSRPLDVVCATPAYHLHPKADQPPQPPYAFSAQVCLYSAALSPFFSQVHFV